MSEERVGRYRILRRIAEARIELRASVSDPPRFVGSRLLADAERQGDAAPRRLYVVTVPDSDTRELLADSLLNCVSLKHGNVLALVDSGVFGERVYAAMAPDGAIALSRLLPAIETASKSDRALAIAAIAADVALGLQSGHDFGSRGLVHDAMDLESIVVDKRGRSRVDAVFFDPWIGSETIAESAAPFAAPERWKAPAGLGTDLFALGAILERLMNGKLGDARPLDVIASLCDPTPERRPRNAQEIFDRLSKAFDLAAAQKALAGLVEAVEAPVSETRVGLGPSNDASAAKKPKLAVPRPSAGRGVKVPAAIPRPMERDRPPQTSRMGSLEAEDDDAESDATVVERSPLFEELEKRPLREENTPIAVDIPVAAGALRAKMDEEDGEEEAGTVVAPLWSAAMAKADAAREDSDIRPAMGAREDLRQSSPAKGWEVKTGSRALGGRPTAQKKDAIPLIPIPKATPFPVEPAQAGAKPVHISSLPVLWNEDSSSDSDVRTRTLPRSGEPTPASAAAPQIIIPKRESSAPVASSPSPAPMPQTEESAPFKKKVSPVQLVLASIILAAILVAIGVVLARR